MNRRSFLSTLAGAFGAFAADPERALWLPGSKLISIPPPAIATPRNLIAASVFTQKALEILMDRLVFPKFERTYQLRRQFEGDALVIAPPPPRFGKTPGAPNSAAGLAAKAR